LFGYGHANFVSDAAAVIFKPGFYTRVKDLEFSLAFHHWNNETGAIETFAHYNKKHANFDGPGIIAGSPV
jgi:hypothetical protein